MLKWIGNPTDCFIPYLYFEGHFIIFDDDSIRYIALT